MKHLIINGVLTPVTYDKEPSSYTDMLKSVSEKFQKIKTPEVPVVLSIKKIEVPDIVLLTRTHFEQLKKQIGQHRPFFELSSLDRINGLPFEVFEDENEMDKRSLELAECGKRCLVCK